MVIRSKRVLKTPKTFDGLEDSVGKLVYVWMEKNPSSRSYRYIGNVSGIESGSISLNPYVRLDLVAKTVGEARAFWFNDWLMERFNNGQIPHSEGITLPVGDVETILELSKDIHHNPANLASSVLGIDIGGFHYNRKRVYPLK